jgi:branched-chain amino acid transport system ATP-binding protein
MAILEAKDINAGYKDVQTLWDASISLKKGTLTSLIGASGTGKTTLLRAIAGLNKLWKGSIWFEGEDVSNFPAHIKANLGLVFIPESRQLFTKMSVYENLEMGATSKRSRPRIKENLERVFTLFPHLKELRDQKSGMLSMGEQKILALARGIMADPKVLIVDELSLGLASVLVLELFESLKQLKKEGITILIAEQNTQLAFSTSDYSYMLASGRNRLEGPTKELIKNEEIRSAYLGI